ncbi:MAG: sugar phosphate isomerase/epimerase [Vicinamibacterales bacterium]|nr:sugar phosphate isomerase/epimerase [Vicinamibacterales bacterium]
MRKFGVSTHLYHGERLRREHLVEMASRGFECLEVFATRSHFDYHDTACNKLLGEWVREAGIQLHSVHAPIVDSLVDNRWGRAYSTAARDLNARQETLHEMDAALALARDVPFKYFVLHLGLPLAQRPGSGDNNRDAALRTIEHIYDSAEPLGVTLTLEVMDNALSRPHVLVDMLEHDLDGLDIGLCMDVGHAHLLGDTAEAIEVASEYLMTTHIHDNRGQKDDHLVPFEGSIDWAATVMELEKIGYDGVLMYEVRNTDGAANVLERCARARKRLESFS